MENLIFNIELHCLEMAATLFTIFWPIFVLPKAIFSSDLKYSRYL